MIALDIDYGRAISVGRDLSIIARTIPAIVSQWRVAGIPEEGGSV
ncbi:MAG: hypothetical protein R3F19_31100 [Verrucomicrobiales bacterium]